MGPKLKAKIVNVWIEGRRGRKKFTMDENNEYNENNPDPDPDCGTPGPRPPSGGRLVDGETGGEGRQRRRRDHEESLHGTPERGRWR